MKRRAFLKKSVGMKLVKTPTIKVSTVSTVSTSDNPICGRKKSQIEFQADLWKSLPSELKLSVFRYLFNFVKCFECNKLYLDSHVRECTCNKFRCFDCSLMSVWIINSVLTNNNDKYMCAKCGPELHNHELQCDSLVENKYYVIASLHVKCCVNNCDNAPTLIKRKKQYCRTHYELHAASINDLCHSTLVRCKIKYCHAPTKCDNIEDYNGKCINH